MERVELLLLLILALFLRNFRVESGDDHFVGELKGHCSDEERDALSNFKRSLFDPQLLLSNWDTSENCCLWKGVGCNSTNGNVILLDLTWSVDDFNFTMSHITGEEWPFQATSFDPSLFRLQHLQRLNLYGIYFNNTSIPQSIDSLTNLRFLFLVDMGLIGVIPPHLGNLTNLRHLDLRNNFLTASNLLWISHLSSLKYLDMTEVNLSLAINWLHEIKILPSLSTLILNSCNLPTLPNLISYSNLSLTIHVFDLSCNQFQNSIIPSWFFNMTNLILLNISYCQLQGSIPNNVLGSTYSLEGLDISKNLIDGSIPQWIGNLSNLYILDLSFNQLSGSIPYSLGQLKNLTALFLYNNQLHGELHMLSNITSKLFLIDLSSNLLEGHLPQLTRYIIYAIFFNNKFSKGIEWYLNANMSSLKILDLSQNHLYGKIPNSICQMPSIIQLDLSQNNLSGKIPKCKGNISSLVTLNDIHLSNNKLCGSIPHWMGNLPWLVSLHLSNNNFHGELSFLGYYNKLMVLDLKQNKFTGNIPLWIGDRLLSLKILCLRSNKFYGSIPSNLSKLKGLQILDLADNFLSGVLPKSFQLLNSMTTPHKRLQPMHLSSFYFFDSLMITIKGVEQEIKRILSLMIIMDLSCNNLTGKIPIELMSLIELRSLNLSNNQFIGQIPNNIGFMESIESLDLSNNHFTGEIPCNIVKLSKLSYLNLSYNQLSGRIPMGTQLDTFNESSYFGNPKLCGTPLIKTCEEDEHNIHNGGSNDDDDDNDDDFDLFLGMGFGFAVGLWSVLGILLLKRSWAIAYFQLYHNITDYMYLFVVVKVNRWFNR